MPDWAVFDVPINEILSGGQNLGMLGQSENSFEWVIIVTRSAEGEVVRQFCMPLASIRFDVLLLFSGNK